MIASGYQLDFYCDDPHHPQEEGLAWKLREEQPFQFSAETKRVAYAQARRAGWRWNKLRETRCPYCAGRLKRAGTKQTNDPDYTGENRPDGRYDL